MEKRRHWYSIAAQAAAGVALLLLAGCARHEARSTSCVWLMGGDEPVFDPDGPPEPTRWALERLLTHGLVEEDSSGGVVPAAAERIEISTDRLSYTFHLRPNLRFTDGAPCGSEDFVRALEGGLNRRDHSTRAWLLAAVVGVDRVRAGRPLPELGIETPDARTLTLRLAQPDSLFLRKLALPGVTDPWSRRSGGGWKQSHGIGPYRVVAGDSIRLLRLARALRSTAPRGPHPPDSVEVRFRVNRVRARALMRSGEGDLLWPLPPRLLEEPLPPAYRLVAHAAVPPYRMFLVMRADVPPTTKLAARRALAHGLNRGALARALEGRAEEPTAWLRGAGPFEFPNLDDGEVRRWLQMGNLGRSFHVVMAYPANGLAAEVARILQEGWSRHSIYVELKPLSGKPLLDEALLGNAHLLLVDAQSPLDDPVADLATLVMPLRGPAVGAFRTGWRTREFDPWITPRAPGPPLLVDAAQLRLEEETVALPLLSMPWTWVEREGGAAVPFHPHFGPACARRGGGP